MIHVGTFSKALFPAYALGEYCARSFPRPGLLLAFTVLAPHQLAPGVEALAKLLAGAG